MVGPIAFQPSELVKIAVIIALAEILFGMEREELELNELLIGGLIVLAPMLLGDPAERPGDSHHLHSHLRSREFSGRRSASIFW
jgi:hypothetical protein